MERSVENARSLFDYDAGEPPGVRATGIDATVRDLAYQAAPERWVRAYLVAPPPDPSQLAGLLFLHPAPGRFADVAAVNLPDLQGERLEHYRRTLAELDPAVWVGRAAPTPLLFQAALHDEVFSEEQSREFFEGASSPKSLEWYDAGYYLDEAARRDRREPGGSR